MSKGSLAAQLSVWLTGLLIALMFAGFVLVFTYAGPALRRDAYARVEDVARDVAAQVKLDAAGRLLPGEESSYRRDGVSAVVQDADGNVLAGRLPRSFPGFSDIVENVNRTTGTWIARDVPSAQAGLFVRAVCPLGGIARTVRSLVVGAAAMYLVLAAVCAVGVYRVARRVLAPIERLTALAQSISSGDDLTSRVPETGPREVRSLARCVNQMLVRLSAAFEGERQFTQDASHELRTPVAVILSQCEDALARPDDVGALRAALEVSLDRARHMARLITQLLMAARADGGQVTLLVEKVDIGELASLVVDDMAERADCMGIALTAHVEGGLVVDGDQTMLMRALVNLVDNALTHHRQTGAGRAVRVEVAQGGGLIRLSVADNGPGIAPEHLPKLWDRFYRVHCVQDKVGVGLGLAMVKWIAQQHAAQLDIQSEVGKGSRFELAFIPPRAVR
ncbi:MAG: HAMP domain-containing sensor histidine kinase [Clostridia bacterium]